MAFDYQTLRYSSPMMDLVTFIANSTGVDVRSKHFDAIFEAYYLSLKTNYSKFAGNQPSDLPEYLSRDNLLREYAVYLPFGLSIAGFFLAALHDPSDMDMEVMMAWSEEEDIRDSFERGGESVDRELRALVLEIYELHQRFGLNI